MEESNATSHDGNINDLKDHDYTAGDDGNLSALDPHQCEDSVENNDGLNIKVFKGRNVNVDNELAPSNTVHRRHQGNNLVLKEDQSQQLDQANSPKSVSRNVDFRELIQSNIYYCDLLWCLFVAAARSYRFSSILRPFPPMFQEGEDKNMFLLKNVISSVPQFSVDPQFWQSLQEESKTLLSWLFNTGRFTLKLQEKDSTFKAIKEMTGQRMDTSEPSYIFEVIPSDSMEEKFEQLRDGRKCFYAYHGSRFDNFFSILHNGLNTHLNKVAVFGEGTYLSSELSVSLMYSQSAESSRHSVLGTKLACVAVCEMIDDPSVKCQIKEGSATTQKARAQASKTTDLVPEKYYVVQRNDVIRVKYLLVYKEQSNQTRQVAARPPSWIQENKFMLLMIAYALLLVAIGTANSRSAMNFIRKFWKN